MERDPILAAEGASELREDLMKIGFSLCAFFPLGSLVATFFIDFYSRLSFLEGKELTEAFMQSPYHPIYMLIGSVLPILICIFLFRLFFKAPFSIKMLSPICEKKHFWIYTLAGLIVLPLGVLVTNSVSQLFSLFGITFNATVAPNGGTETIIFILIHAICAPIFEELLFRGYILERLRRFGDIFAVIASAFLFSMLHASFQSIPFAFISGVIFGILAVKTGSILSSMIIHGANNIFSVIWILLSTSSIKSLDIIFYIILAVFGLISAMAILFLTKMDPNAFSLTFDSGHIKATRKAALLLTSFSMLVFYMFSLTLSISSIIG